MKKVIFLLSFLCLSFFSQAQISIMNYFDQIFPVPGISDSIITLTADTFKVKGNLVVTGKIITGANDTTTLGRVIIGGELNAAGGITSAGGVQTTNPTTGNQQILADAAGLSLSGGIDSTVQITITDSIHLNGSVVAGDLSAIGDISGDKITSRDTIFGDVGMFTGNVLADGIYLNGGSFLSTFLEGNFNFKSFTNNTDNKSVIGCYNNASDELGTFIELAPGNTGSIFFGNSASQNALATIDYNGNFTAIGDVTSDSLHSNTGNFSGNVHGDSAKFVTGIFSGNLYGDSAKVANIDVLKITQTIIPDIADALSYNCTVTRNVSSSNNKLGQYGYIILFGTGNHKSIHTGNDGDGNTATAITSSRNITISNIPTSTDPRVDRRYIYRSYIGNNNSLALIDSITDNSTTTYVDSQNDYASYDFITSTIPNTTGSTEIDTIGNVTAKKITTYTLLSTVIELTPALIPETPVEGMIYSNASDHHLYYYNGTAWVQLDN